MPTENNGWKPNGLDRLMIEGAFHHQWREEVSWQ
jgi:hypothetical protein